MSIQASLKKLMADEGWTAESVIKKIKKLQGVSVEKGNLIPYVLLGERKQKILAAVKQQEGAVEILGASTALWFSVSRSRNLVATDILRVNPSSTIPDLSETPPRYESGTWLAGVTHGTIYQIVDRSLYQDDAPAWDDWCACRDKDGEIDCLGLVWDNWQVLPPRPELDGWEIVRAACIDGTQELGEGETWVSNEGICASCPGGVATAQEKGEYFCNQWRWVARKVEQEGGGGSYVDVALRRAIEAEQEEKVEYVDYEVDPHVSSEIVYFYEGAWRDLAMAVGNKRFIAYIYADGTLDHLPRRCDGIHAAEWPTAVRFEEEAE